MNNDYALREDESRGEIYRSIYLLVTRQGGGWQAAGAAFCLVGGALTFPPALVLWAAAKFVGPFGIGPALNLSSTILFVMVLPLLALGSCFLDHLEKKSSAPPPPAEARTARAANGRRLRPRHPRLN